MRKPSDRAILDWYTKHPERVTWLAREWSVYRSDEDTIEDACFKDLRKAIQHAMSVSVSRTVGAKPK